MTKKYGECFITDIIIILSAVHQPLDLPQVSGKIIIGRGTKISYLRNGER